MEQDSWEVVPLEEIRASIVSTESTVPAGSNSRLSRVRTGDTSVRVDMGGGSPFFNAQIIRLFQSLEYYSKIYHMLGLVLQSKIADLLATIFVLEINSLPHWKSTAYRIDIYSISQILSRSGPRFWSSDRLDGCFQG
jgi:hypothetical protein